MLEFCLRLMPQEHCSSGVIVRHIQIRNLIEGPDTAVSDIAYFLPNPFEFAPLPERRLFHPKAHESLHSCARTYI